MANDFFGNFQEAVWNAIRSAVRVGVVGRKESDGTTTIIVPGRDHYIYVRTGATNSGGEVLEAYNKGIPRLAGAPCLLIKWNRVWTVIGVDSDSPAVTAETYSVSYHQHLRDNGLSQSVHDLDGMPSSIAGRAGALLRVNEDEDGYYLADSASGGTGTVDSVNSETGDVVLDADDIAETASRIWFTTAEETKLAGIEALADVTDAANVGAAIDGATAKTTPVDADTMPLIDSAASNVLKKVTWANIKATLKTYFDTLYGLLGSANTWTAANTFSSPLTHSAGSWINMTDPDVAHGITDILPTDQYGQIASISGLAGGLLFFGFSDTDATAFQLVGIIGSDNPTDSTPAVLVAGSKKNGTTAQALGSTETVFALDNSTTRLLAVLGSGYMGLGTAAPFFPLHIRAVSGLNLGFTDDAAGRFRMTAFNNDGSALVPFTMNSLEYSFMIGDVGIGTTSPQGKLHVHDGTGGHLFFSKTGINGTPQTIIPDGTGDVTAAVLLEGIADSSGASPVTFFLLVQVSGSGLVNVGPDTITFAVSAGGALTVAVTGGAATWTVVGRATWL